MDESNPQRPDKRQALYDLGVAMGQTQALNLIAGRCTAAQAACIRRIRNEKLFLEFCDTWEEFCDIHLGISRSEANRVIHLLDEFGPGYHQMAQFTRISPATYRAIAPKIRDGALHLDGEEIELCVENAKRITAAVAELRRELPEPAAKKASKPSGVSDRVADLDERARQVVADFEELAAMERENADWPLLRATLTRTCSALKRIEDKAE
jgi:hypothetical protein